MTKVLAVLLGAVVIAELLLVLGVAAALFWLGSTGPVVAATAMLVVAGASGLIALRAIRPRR